MKIAGQPSYTPPADRDDDAGGSHASYTPSANINPMAYGRDGGKANAQGGTVPEVVVGGASEMAPVPAMPGTLRIGENKNVSTPVSG